MRWRAVVAGNVAKCVVVAVGLGASVLVACSDDEGGATPTVESSPAPVPTDGPIAAGVDDGCFVLGAGDIGGVVGGVAVDAGGAGSDPYALQGARQAPGPDLSTVPMAGPPVSVVVARPGDPDANSPAKQPPGPDGLPSTPSTTLSTTLSTTPGATDGVPPVVADTAPGGTVPAGAGTVSDGCLEVP